MREYERYQQHKSAMKMATKAGTRYVSMIGSFSWELNFRENHCAMDSVNLEADNGSRGCRTPHEKALTFKHRPRRGVKLLKTRGNWMKVVVVAGVAGKMVERRKKHGMKTVFAAKRISDPVPFYPVSIRAFYMVPTMSRDPPLTFINMRRAIKSNIREKRSYRTYN